MLSVAVLSTVLVKPSMCLSPTSGQWTATSSTTKSLPRNGRPSSSANYHAVKSGLPLDTLADSSKWGDLSVVAVFQQLSGGKVLGIDIEHTSKHESHIIGVLSLKALWFRRMLPVTAGGRHRFGSRPVCKLYRS